MKIDGVKFKRKVVPGDTLHFEVQLLEPIRRGVAVVEGKEMCIRDSYIVGDSMYPLLKSGDIVLYKQLKDIGDIFWGDMYPVSYTHLPFPAKTFLL